MNRNFRRRGLGAAFVVAAVMVPMSWAWACVGLVSLTANPNSGLQPGATISVTGREFAAKAPVMIHLDAIDGPVLATAPGPASTMTSQFVIMVTLPNNISSGEHMLVATQDEHNMNGGNPARALIYVNASAPAPATPAARPATLLAKTAPHGGTLILIAVVVGGVALFVAGLILYGTGKRGDSEATTTPGVEA